MEPKISKDTLDKLRKVRVVDVSDALDSLGILDSRTMDPGIKALWQPVKVVGIAKTIKLLPRILPVQPVEYESFEDYLMKTQVGYVFEKKSDQGVNEWDQLLDDHLRHGAKEELEGSVLVYDAGGLPISFWGSEISLRAKEKGVVGTVIDGGCRDIHEIKLEEYPVFNRLVVPGMGGNRLSLGGVDIEIQCGGVMVRPGDIIIGDEHGVIAIPPQMAEEVADRALRVLDQDIKWRRMYYKKLGIKPDYTIEAE
ncbi:hypothetical protein E3J84_01640 [Candidatus Aerophobetes bacterium]|uniref:Regulator of ribonuclease activity homolog n=1 Tax=Aerophobetes bacterium TaxID=2030807 RepID=A0A523S340_UNCAE|nr:MAG: hypothetical protein E3J84_01640 [Candidatus Aerophobetes bacterium]